MTFLERDTINILNIFKDRIKCGIFERIQSKMGHFFKDTGNIFKLIYPNSRKSNYEFEMINIEPNYLFKQVLKKNTLKQFIFAQFGKNK